MKWINFTLWAILCFTSINLNALDVYDVKGGITKYPLSSLQTEKLVNFETNRHKDGKDIKETWQGIPLQKWLSQHQYTDFQSIRLESTDNYMVRIHKAELDSMPGYLALKKDNKLLDSLEIRVIFPKQRDMFWVRGIQSIFLEDFKPIPHPNQIFIWDTEMASLTFYKELPIFKALSGYEFNEIMRTVFHQDTGSVVIVSRDGLKSRLEYPKHLQDAVLEKMEDGTINLKSPTIPAGMWLKDVIYLQCGPYAVIKHDYLYRLHSLYKLLDWKEITPSEQIIKANVTKQTQRIDTLTLPDAIPFKAGEWIELP
jgi:hypothetical protein